MGVTEPKAFKIVETSGMKFFSYNLTTELTSLKLLDDSTTPPKVVNCLNPHSFITAEVDARFKEALLSSTYLIPDGIGICMALEKYKGIKIKKIAGEDFHYELLRQLNEKGGKIFYLGSNNIVLNHIADRIHKEYPNLVVKTYSPSYCDDFSSKENAELVSLVESFAPDALLIGMTAPKQEKWVYKNINKLTTPKIIGCIGGAFEFFAGTIKRAPKWMINCRLEWFYRFLQEPRRMWRRNLVSTPRFLKYVKKHKTEI